MLLFLFSLLISLHFCSGTYDEKEEHFTYMHYPHFHFAGRFRADTATLNNFPNLFDPGNFTQNTTQPSFDNWNPMGSGEWSVEAEVTHACYSNYSCVNLPGEKLCGAGISGGGTKVPAKLVDLDPQAHKFAEVWGWRVIVGEFFSADFLPAPFQYRWVKTANGSGGDAEQAAAGQSQLTNIIWNEENTKKSSILQEIKSKSTNEKLSIRFNMDSFNEFPQQPYFGWGRITGTIGLAGSQSSPFTPGERILKAQTEGIQDAPFVINKKAKKLTVDFGNSLPIMKNGSHNVTFIGQLLVAVPRKMPDDNKAVSCNDDLQTLGIVIYRIENWYKNSAGVHSFPPIGVLSDEEIEKLESMPLVVAEVEGTWPAVQCKRILFSEANDGIQVHPFTPWVLRAEPGEEVEISFLATKFGRPSAGSKIHITPFICFNIFYEYGGPPIGTEPLPFPAQSRTTNQFGLATIKFKAHDPQKAREFIDGQLYPYVYWAESNPIDPKQICDGSNFLYLLNSYFVIRVFDRHTDYQDPPTWNEDVYPIFKKYADLYPIMTLNYVDLGNYHEVMKHIFHINMTMHLPLTHPNYMPVTRDLSRDKRNMIFKWLNRPCPGEEVEEFTLDRLRQHLQTALEIEHATIPTYLTALATIKESYNLEVHNIFKQILIQEMLHMALAANLLNAVGGKPVIFSDNFLPLYPTRLPGGLMPTLQVPIEKCSIGLIADIFMAIEQPSITADFSEPSPEPAPPKPDDVGEEITAGADPSNLEVTGQYGTKEDSSSSIKKKKCGSIPSPTMKGGPTYPGEKKPIFHKHYNTIGEFYNHTLEAFIYLTKNGTNQTIFSGNKSRQLVFDFHFGRYGRLINVTDFESAKQAIQEIIREGEGSSPCNPLDWSNNNGDLSHYFLFKSIVERHKILVSGDRSDERDSGFGKETIPSIKICKGEYFFNGSKIFFDPDGVWPMVNNPRLRKSSPGSRADVLNIEFNKLYTNLLRSLEVTFNGHPDKFGDALGLMFSIDRHLKRLVSTPLEQDGDPTVGPNAGPTFEFMPD